VRRRAVLALVGAAAIVAAPASAAPPRLDQLVVFKSGKSVERRVSTRGLNVRVRRHRCAVPGRTALATLVRARPGHIRLRDFGSCSRRAGDASGLYVAAIGRERERGRGGWVYKVGRRAAPAGAADPAGPFGSGRLRAGQRVLWFYCLRAGDCQRTLSVRATARTGTDLAVAVTGYDDDGKGKRVAGATVHVGGATAVTGPEGVAHLTVLAGRHRAFAEKAGLVRSFTERITVG
jgi:hypothetical protein